MIKRKKRKLFHYAASKNEYHGTGWYGMPSLDGEHYNEKNNHTMIYLLLWLPPEVKLLLSFYQWYTNFLDWWSSNDGPISYWVRVSAVKALLTSNASIFRMCPHRGKSGWACSFFGTIRSVSQFFQEIRFLRNMSRSVPRNFRNWILRFSVIPVWFRF